MALYIRDVVKEWINWFLKFFNISQSTGLIYQSIIAVVVSILFMVVAGNVLAADTDVRHFQLMNPNGLVDEVHIPQALFTRDVGDTVFFGGDDGNGVAFEGGVWDFDTIVSDPLQGFTSRDKTANPGDYFARVTANDFAQASLQGLNV